MDSGRTYDLERLNALLDGELTPTERAEIAARLASDRDLASAYATLARLKAATAETTDDCPSFVLRRPRWLMVRRHATAIAACIELAAAGGLLVEQAWLADGVSVAGTAEGPMEIELASLPAGATIPRLDSAGLKLINLVFDPGHVPLFTATYRGPHGCRLDLRGWPMGADAPPAPGSSLHRSGRRRPRLRIDRSRHAELPLQPHRRCCRAADAGRLPTPIATTAACVKPTAAPRPVLASHGIN